MGGSRRKGGRVKEESFYIRSQRVLVGRTAEPVPAALKIRNGKIEKIIGYSEIPENQICFEGENNLLMPGIFDTHAHINEPGRTDWEGFETATHAAAAGGMTTVIDMPLNSIPATTTLQALLTKKKSAVGKCKIRYGFWGGVVPGNSHELEPMVNEGALGFKCFLIESGVEEFPMTTEIDLKIAMPILKKLGVPLLVHAEIDCGSTSEITDPRAYQGYLESRPEKWEVEAIRMMIRLARETGCRVHIVHLSAAGALNEIKKAKSEGVPISVETCPHYLYFESEKISAGATDYKCAPPIRNHENRERLWNGLKEGVIDFIVSDHSPCTAALKSLQSGDFSQAWGGISGLQFSLPAVWTEMKKRGLSFRSLSTWMSARTAEFSGMGDEFGVIEEGYFADIVLWNPDKEIQIQKERVLHRNKVTPYLGHPLHGEVLKTWIGGELVFDEEKFPSLKTYLPVRRKVYE